MSNERLIEREQQNMDALQNTAIDAIRRQVPRGRGPANCVECDNDIPSGRRALGYDQCVECKMVSERA